MVGLGLGVAHEGTEKCKLPDELGFNENQTEITRVVKMQFLVFALSPNPKLHISK